MNTQLTIKNFRIFDENGATVDLKPITILTGCNSSGKSSVVKAAMMLSEFWNQQKEKVNLSCVNIDLTKPQFNLIGKIDNILHNGSQSKTIVFEYTVYSYLISKEVTVKLKFDALLRDRTRRIADLKNIEMTTEDGVVLWQTCTELDIHSVLFGGISGTTYVNYTILKDPFLDFLALGCVYKKYIDLDDKYDDCDKEEKKRIDDEFNILKEYKERYNCKDENRINDIKRVMSDYFWPETPGYREKKLSFVKGNLSEITEIVEKVHSTGILFYIEILDQIGDMDKDVFRDYVKRNKMQKDKKSKAVVDEFLKSDYETFGEYYKAKEQDYISSYEVLRNQSHGFFSTEVYEVLTKWNNDLISEDDKYCFLKTFADNKGTRYVSKIEDSITSFTYAFIHECVCPSCCDFSYVSSSRATIKRLYQLDANDEFTILLKKYMNFDESRGSLPRVGDDDYRGYVHEWMTELGIGYEVTLRLDDNGTGMELRLHKTPDDKNGRLLADEGYGITQLLSILLAIDMSERNTTIVIEEPEIHLHPKFQSLLADMFVEAYKCRQGINFIIETHSEYLIRRLQLLVAGIDANLKLDKNDVSISYIYTKEEAEKENQPLVKNISICEDGYLNDTFGSGFFDEASNLSHKLLNINAN